MLEYRLLSKSAHNIAFSSKIWYNLFNATMCCKASKHISFCLDVVVNVYLFGKEEKKDV